MNEKKPFAYSIRYYDELDIFDTLEKAVEHLINNYIPERCYNKRPILAHFSDGTKEGVDINEYIGIKDVNIEEVKEWVKVRMEESKDAHDEWLKENPNLVGSTGSMPYFMFNFDRCVEAEVNNRKYFWKMLEEKH